MLSLPTVYVTKKDRNGATLLHHVLANTNLLVAPNAKELLVPLIRTIIKMGGSLHHRAHDGKTPMDMIMDRKDVSQDVIATLQELEPPCKVKQRSDGCRQS